ncbi:HNH endonuclease [Streptomyces somaliensis DSM 40738]|uniref:Restriction endonuclease n=1 Tax=Streptomyces somaliensis (strain ATCC 33201 / DSM 40738 / JCM 12659 / KCTC 9044 / NCTC 11332 / NRRL B-12077 / IP 733) TaxID=1134445 RepID=A0AA44DC60_STRE0|nr:HNH endonuclease [Streptomyces somaliensis]MCQ0024830.1 HNH endonuclease [Streptomyces somaliensis DSM 40738]NKY13685.1 restriction endonuclease [Streptomyces somaliensis DSM 40738]
MDWLERAAALRQWTRDGARAPHKPLLLLYGLGRFQQDADGELVYSEVEEDLKRLLSEYGPPHRTTPAYPFHHLTSDGVWEVRTDRGPGSPGSVVRELRATGAAGRLAAELRTALRRDPPLLGRMARVLLDQHFPPSLHGELCEAIGLELEPAETVRLPSARRQRDRRMRDLVLTAYEHRCAFCGYDGRIGATPVGLEAAHVRWWAFGGPDDVDNGLCLCALHHKLFDKGVLGVGDDHRILVSQRFVGHSAAAREHVTALAGRPLIGPRPGVRPPAAHHRSWHTGQVFHGAPRPGPDLPRSRSRGGSRTRS